MKIGTKSLLFGVHQFLWHPWTVARAWRHLYGVWPDRYEWCAIFFHDWGYWGCPNIDGREGRLHPQRGACLARRWAKRIARWSGESSKDCSSVGMWIYEMSLYHSRELSKRLNVQPSKLCWADKAACFFDPPWLYLLRAKLSGEIHEFYDNAKGYISPRATHRDWYMWYRLKVRALAQIERLLATR